MNPNKNICIFLGSAFGNNPIYKEMTEKLGAAIVQYKMNLVYGGSSVGLMGVLADSVLKHGGKVYGVTPEVIKTLEIQHKGLTELHEVDSMHDRKAKMYELSDAFVAFPGGFGTLDEFCEITTWMQLGYHQKPLVILNINNFFTPFSF